MTQTFTHPLPHPATNPEKESPRDFSLEAEPSDACIQTILNFSKNLDVKPSRLLPGFEYIKS
jgi:hypothetical protein